MMLAPAFDFLYFRSTFTWAIPCRTILKINRILKMYSGIDLTKEL